MSYIEREALLEEIQEELDFESTMYTEEQNKYINMGLKIAQGDIKRRPAADVVPVVRCKNCVQSRETEDEEICFCMQFADTVLADGFCSYGERSEE